MHKKQIHITYSEDTLRKEANMNNQYNRRGRNRDSRPLAMAYVRKQSWRRVYKMDVALTRGTLFNELDKPFSGVGRGGRNCGEK